MAPRQVKGLFMERPVVLVLEGVIAEDALEGRLSTTGVPARRCRVCLSPATDLRGNANRSITAEAYTKLASLR